MMSMTTLKEILDEYAAVEISEKEYKEAQETMEPEKFQKIYFYSFKNNEPNSDMQFFKYNNKHTSELNLLIQYDILKEQREISYHVMNSVQLQTRMVKILNFFYHLTIIGLVLAGIPVFFVLVFGLH